MYFSETASFSLSNAGSAAQTSRASPRPGYVFLVHLEIWTGEVSPPASGHINSDEGTLNVIKLITFPDDLSGGNRQEGNIFQSALMQEAFRQASLKVSARGAPRGAIQFSAWVAFFHGAPGNRAMQKRPNLMSLDTFKCWGGTRDRHADRLPLSQLNRHRV